MNMNAVSHASALNSPSRGAAARQDFAAQRHEAAAGDRIRQNTNDFSDMSRSEFDSLWRDGEIDMRLPPLVLPSTGLDLTKDTKAQMEAVYDQQIDFIQHFQNRIEFQKTLPRTETNQTALKLYEDGLSLLTDLSDESMRSSVNAKA